MLQKLISLLCKVYCRPGWQKKKQQGRPALMLFAFPHGPLTRSGHHSPSYLKKAYSSVFSVETEQCCCSVAKSCPALCDPMDCSTPGSCILYCPPEFAQSHVHWVGEAVQPSHPLSSPSPPALSFPASGSLPVSRLCASGGQSIGAPASALVLPMNIQGWFPLGLTSLISL